MRSSFWERLVKGVRRTWQRPDWIELLGDDWADRVMQVEITDDFHAKQGRSTGRFVVKNAGRELTVYLKRHYRLPWWRGVLATLYPDKGWSPAFHERDRLLWARKEEIPVPAVAAAAEYVGPWFRLQSLLAVEELTEMLPLHQAIPAAAEGMTPLVFRKWKKRLIEELARLARRLHQRRHYHKDLYLCHFFLPRSDIELWQGNSGSMRGRLYMIDFHRLVLQRWTWPFGQLKDLAQLLYSSEQDGVTLRDRIWFWKLYRENKARSRLLRWWEACIRWKWRRYRTHNLKRRSAQRHKQSIQKKAAA